MWIIEKYLRLIVAFAALWGILYVSGRFGCNTVHSNQMQPFMTSESFVIVHAFARFPDQVEVPDSVLQFERSMATRAHSRYVARLIGKPGDRIRMTQGKMYRTPKGASKEEPLAEPYISQELMSPSTEEIEEIVIPRGCYWLMGDNRRREGENDSRKFGPIPVHAVDGMVTKMPFTH